MGAECALVSIRVIFNVYYTLPHSVIQCKVNNEIQFLRGK